MKISIENNEIIIPSNIKMLNEFTDSILQEERKK